MTCSPQHRRRRAVTMIVALAALLAVTLTGGQLLRSLARAHRQARQHQWNLQALWLADGGLARAAAQLQANPDYAGETWRPAVATSQQAPVAAGVVKITVTKDPAVAARRNVRVEAVYPDDPIQRALQTRQQVIFLPSRGDSR